MSRPMVMCQEISQYRPKQIDETDTMPDHTNHGIGAECAIELARSALGAEIPNGTVCPIDWPEERIAIPFPGDHRSAGLPRKPPQNPQIENPLRTNNLRTR